MKTFAILDDSTPGYIKKDKRHKVTIVVSDPERNLYNRVFAENVLESDAKPLVELLNLHHDLDELASHARMSIDAQTTAKEADSAYTADDVGTHPWDTLQETITQRGDDGSTIRYVEDGEFREIRGLFEFRSFKESPRQGFPTFVGEREAAGVEARRKVRQLYLAALDAVDGSEVASKRLEKDYNIALSDLEFILTLANNKTKLDEFFEILEKGPFRRG